MAHVSGQLSFSITEGISRASVGLDDNLDAGLNLGLAASAAYSQQFETTITSVGLPGFNIPNVITVGPTLGLGAELDFNIKAAGQILAGAHMTIPNFQAGVDLKSGQSSASGFTPVFTTQFNASGQITATADLGIPITVGIGLDIFPLKDSGKKMVSIINTPSLEATATYSYSNTASGVCNNGVAYSLNFLDDTSYEILGLKSGDIYDYRSPSLVSGCKLILSYPFIVPHLLKLVIDSSFFQPVIVPDCFYFVINTRIFILVIDSVFLQLIVDSTAATITSSPSTQSQTSTAAPGSTSPSTTGVATSLTSTPGSTTRVSLTNLTTTSGTFTNRTSTNGALVTGSTTSQPNITLASGTGIFTSQTLASGTQPTATSNSSRFEYFHALQRPALVSSPNPSPSASTDDSLSSLADSSESSASNTTNSDGSTYMNMTDSTGRYTLSTDESGSFHIVSASTLDPAATFLSYDNVVLSDMSGRIMRFYPDTMAAFNVSRFRLSSTDAWPKTSEMVSLVTVDYDNDPATPAVSVASDTLSHYYYTVLCNLQGQYSKVFLVADPVAGVEILKREDLQHIMTGEVVTDCSTIAFLSSGPGF
ncbi:MAG: hypothetical protein Q9227_007593 [Pyrenula ochraceoflavens]